MGEVLKQTLKGVKWTALETVSLKVIQFGISIVIARILTPADYGLVGMISIFIAIASSFVDSGMSNALVRKQGVTEDDYCTVYIFNMVVSFVAYAVLFLSAPWIAEFFNEPKLVDVVRVISINLILGAFSGVQAARFQKELDFKIQAKISIISSLLSGAIGIALAYNGFGVWALVYQMVGYTGISSVLKILLSKWKPKIIFSRKSFDDLFGYGSKLLLSGLLHTIYTNLTTLLIGKFYTPKALGYYSRGESWPALAEQSIMTVLGRVTFPILSKLQDDREHLLSIYRKYIKGTSLVTFIVIIMLCALSKPLISLLLTDKWLPAVPYMQLFCFAYLFDNICILNLNLLQVLGRSDLFLKLEIVKKSLSMTMLLCSVPFGVMAICVVKLVYCCIAVLINMFYTARLFDYGYVKQFKDFMPYTFYALIASLPAYLLTFTNMHNIVIIFVGSLIGLIIYSFILKLKNDSIFYEYVLKRIKFTK